MTERKHFAGEVDAYIGELAVARGYERRGIGAALVAVAEAWSRERRYPRITLDTGAGNVGARAFYAALGFAEEDIRLSKPLTNTPPGPELSRT